MACADENTKSGYCNYRIRLSKSLRTICLSLINKITKSDKDWSIIAAPGFFG
jgi:hypothetical protein